MRKRGAGINNEVLTFRICPDNAKKSFWREYKERDQVFVYAYILMSNHVHLLLEATESPISRLM